MTDLYCPVCEAGEGQNCNGGEVSAIPILRNGGTMTDGYLGRIKPRSSGRRGGAGSIGRQVCNCLVICGVLWLLTFWQEEKILGIGRKKEGTGWKILLNKEEGETR